MHHVMQGLKRPELRDELYMQLVKQTRGSPSAASRAKAWGMFNLVAAAMPPSKEFTGLISEYVHSAVQVMEARIISHGWQRLGWPIQIRLAVSGCILQQCDRMHSM